MVQLVEYRPYLNSEELNQLLAFTEEVIRFYEQEATSDQRRAIDYLIDDGAFPLLVNEHRPGTTEDGRRPDLEGGREYVGFRPTLNPSLIMEAVAAEALIYRGSREGVAQDLSLIHISEPTRPY